MAEIGQTEGSTRNMFAKPTLASNVSVNVGSGTNQKPTVQELKLVDSSVPLTVWQVDMSKAYYFKYYISGLFDDMSLYADTDSMFKTDKLGKFLPIDSIVLSPVSVASTSLQIGVFADLPLITRRNVGRLKITLLDSDNQQYERALYNWFASCIPTGTGYVKCLDDIVKYSVYKCFDGKGKETGQYGFYVMPDGEVSVDLSYSMNDLKKINFNLIIVSEITNLINTKRIGEAKSTGTIINNA